MIQRRPLTRHALSDFTYFVTGANFPVGGRVGRRHTFPEVGRRPTSPPRPTPPRGGPPPSNFFSHLKIFFSVVCRVGRSPTFPKVVPTPPPRPTPPRRVSLPPQFVFQFFFQFFFCRRQVRPQPHLSRGGPQGPRPTPTGVDLPLTILFQFFSNFFPRGCGLAATSPPPIRSFTCSCLGAGRRGLGFGV